MLVHPYASSFVRLVVHSYVYSFVSSFVHSFVCSFIRMFIRSLVHSFIRSFVRSFVCLFVGLFVSSFVCSFVHLFIHSYVYSFVSSFVHQCIPRPAEPCLILRHVHFWRSIPRESEVNSILKLRVLHRNFFGISDELLGDVAICLKDLNCYERPRTK